MHIIRRRGAALLGAALLQIAFARPVRALDPTRSIRQFVHRTWDIEDGLPQIWMGTGGMDEYLSKPIDAPRLIELIERIVSASASNVA